MLSDMIATVKKAESDAAKLIEYSGKDAEGIMKDARETAERNVKKTRERVKAQTAKALFEQEERETAKDEKAEKETLARAQALRADAARHAGELEAAVRELMLV